MFDVRIHGGGDGDDYSIYFVVAGRVGAHATRSAWLCPRAFLRISVRIVV
jgi:hypothetical protein